MHIENMKNSIETLTTMLSAEVAKGADACLEEMSEVADIIKDLSEAKYHCSITQEMEDTKQEEEILAKNGATSDTMRYYGGRRGYYYDPMVHGTRYYGDYRYSPRYYDGGMSNTHYYNDNRYSDGTYAPSGRGTRRGYSSTYPDMYDPANSYNQNKWRMSESDYDRSKRYYTETKMKHSGDTKEDKTANLESLEEYMKTLTEDLVDIIGDASSEERSMIKQKMSTLVSKL